MGAVPGILFGRYEPLETKYINRPTAEHAETPPYPHRPDYGVCEINDPGPETTPITNRTASKNFPGELSLP